MMKDFDFWERSAGIADVLIEDGDGCLYLTVLEYYVGRTESSGGNGLRTTRYALRIGDDDGTIGVEKPITPWQMVTIGERFLAAGLRQLREQRRSS